MFRLFEKLLHPYPEPEPRPQPKRFGAFLWACTEGLRGYIVALALLSAAIAGYEAWLLAMLGQVVDWLGGIAPGQLWAQQQDTITLFAVVLMASVVLVAFQTVVKHQTLAINFPLRLRWNDRPDARPLVVSRGEVKFEALRFGYGKPQPVIEDFTLTVKPGEKIGLIGRSGAGKSTLVNLLLRFYDVEGGRILVDGQDIAGVTQDSLRANIGMVTQDTSLLHRSVRDNILYGRPGASDEEMIRAAQRAQAHGFIGGLSDPQNRRGYDAHVGERGVKLSGGQRQRVAIARVMLKDAPIRLSTIAALDRLVVLDQGRIVEEGSHRELLAAGGLYARLWSHQSGGFLGESSEEEALAL